MDDTTGQIRSERSRAADAVPGASNRNNPVAPADLADLNHVTLARLLTRYSELVIDLGGNPDALLDTAGLARDDLRNPFALLPVRSIGQLLENSATMLGCPDFGLRIAERQSLETIMQPLDRLFRTAPTVRDALEHCSRHIGAYNSGLAMEIGAQDLDGLEFGGFHQGAEHNGSLHMVDFKLINGLSLFPQFMEQLLLLTHKCIAWLSAGFAHSRMVWFSHLNIGSPVDYARRFNTVIRFGQEYDALLFRDSDLQTRIAESNAELFASEARLAAMRFPSRDKDIVARVSQAIFQSLTRWEVCNRQNIARRLGFQERTLNRHLHRKGTTFEAIRDELRRNLAFRYLARADLSLSDIAGRLGYSELAVLSRCCQRWFGQSPRQLRQNLLSDRPAQVRDGKLRSRRAALGAFDGPSVEAAVWPGNHASGNRNSAPTL